MCICVYGDLEERRKENYIYICHFLPLSSALQPTWAVHALTKKECLGGKENILNSSLFLEGTIGFYISIANNGRRNDTKRYGSAYNVKL